MADIGERIDLDQQIQTTEAKRLIARPPMNDIVSPFCLVLSLLLFIAAFAVLVRDKPQPGIALHRARVEADDQYSEVLERQLERRGLQRKVLIGSLFGMAVIVAGAGFAVMRPPPPG